MFALFDFDDDHAISKDELVCKTFTFPIAVVSPTRPNFPLDVQTILFISTCYALLAFRNRIPRDLILLNKLKRNCEKLAKDGFASRQVHSIK